MTLNQPEVTAPGPWRVGKPGSGEDVAPELYDALVTLLKHVTPSGGERGRAVHKAELAIEKAGGPAAPRPPAPVESEEGFP